MGGRYRTALGLNGFGWAHVIYGTPYDFRRILRHAASLGFDAVELFGMPTPYPESAKDRRALKKLVAEHGLRIASIQSLPGGLGNGHPGSAYSLCRNDYAEFIRKSLGLAADLGCDCMGVWAGELFGSGPSRQTVAYMTETYARCAEMAKDAGIPICLEAEPVQQVNTPEVWFKILKGVDSSFMKAICDFGHLNVLSGQQPLRLLNRLLPYVGHTHLCDNDGKCTRHESRSSKHLPLGEGTMDWRKVLERLLDGGYAGWLDVDVWEHPDPFGASEKSKRALDAFLAERSHNSE
ncbi:MAG TPA: sugar phosphate isomerase/epimerase family protein [Candidatus Brocadiia bacterium]|nr:sugar phosphate isomerase/epimerase family protein [Candidatus Brocadiia bacterium]